MKGLNYFGHFVVLREEDNDYYAICAGPHAQCTIPIEIGSTSSIPSAEFVVKRVIELLQVTSTSLGQSH